MPKLVAVAPILYASRQYRIGECLPAHNPILVDAWLESGAAAWKEEDDTPKAPAVKAIPVTAEPGLSGMSSDGDPDALVGKATKTPQRKRVPKK